MKKAILILLFFVLTFVVLGSQALALYRTIYAEGTLGRLDFAAPFDNLVGCNETRSWECVQAYSDSKYMYAYAALPINHLELFEMNNLTNISNDAVIDRIQLQWRAKRYSTTYDTFTPALFVSDGSPDRLYFYNETREITLGGAWKFYTVTYYRNPLTNAAWTVNQVNTLKAGMFLKAHLSQGGYFDHFKIYVYYH